MKNILSHTLSLSLASMLMCPAAFASEPSTKIPPAIGLPTPGNSAIHAETQISAPYKSTENYVYATGTIFERWIYSPWTKTSFEGNTKTVINEKNSEKAGILSVDFRVSTESLKANTSYLMDLEAKYKCQPIANKETDHCRITWLVRCFIYDGDTPQETLRKTVTKNSDETETLSLNNIPVSEETCAEGILVSLRGRMLSQADSFGISEIKIDLDTPK